MLCLLLESSSTIMIINLASTPGSPKSKLIGFALLVTGITLGSFACWLTFAHGGKELQQKFLGTYLSVDATVSDTYINYDPGHFVRWNHGSSVYSQSGYFLFLDADYQVDGSAYSNEYTVKTWPSINEEQDAKQYAATYLQPGDATTVYYNPADPSNSVLDPAEEPHLWLDFIFFLPAITISVIMTIISLVLLLTKAKAATRRS